MPRCPLAAHISAAALALAIVATIIAACTPAQRQQALQTGIDIAAQDAECVLEHLALGEQDPATIALACAVPKSALPSVIALVGAQRAANRRLAARQNEKLRAAVCGDGGAP